MGVTIHGVAVALRKVTLGGGAQNLYAHSPTSQFRVSVGVDFAVQTHLFELRASPFHRSLLLFLNV